MQNPTDTTDTRPTLAVEATSQAPAAAVPWHEQATALLERAAQLCAAHDVELDAFMKGAWTAYVESRPGLRDFLEEAQLRAQLDELRKAGRLGSA
jgi:hypothetical protein